MPQPSTVNDCMRHKPLTIDHNANLVEAIEIIVEYKLTGLTVVDEAGAAVVLSAGTIRASEIGLGTFFGLLAAVFYGAYYLVTQRGRAHLSTMTYFWISTATAAGSLLLINLLLGQPLTGYSAQSYIYFLALGVVAQTLGWLTINYAQGYLPASIVAPTLLGQPVLTAVLAVLLLGERFTPWQVIGGFLVLLGVYLVHRVNN